MLVFGDLGRDDFVMMMMMIVVVGVVERREMQLLYENITLNTGSGISEELGFEKYTKADNVILNFSKYNSNHMER